MSPPSWERDEEISLRNPEATATAIIITTKLTVMHPTTSPFLDFNRDDMKNETSIYLVFSALSRISAADFSWSEAIFTNSSRCLASFLKFFSLRVMRMQFFRAV